MNWIQTQDGVIIAGCILWAYCICMKLYTRSIVNKLREVN